MQFNNQYADWKSWSGSFRCTPTDAATFDGEFAAFSFQGLRVLEVGFGDGRFLAWASDKGARCSGCELIPKMVELGSALGFDVRLGKVEEVFVPAQDRFDLIVALDVLEHLPLDEVPSLLMFLKSLLDREGQMLFRVPNGESPFGLAAQNGDLTHVSVHSRGRFGQLAMSTGLCLREARNAYRLVQPDAGWWGRRDRVRYWVRSCIEGLLGFAYGHAGRPMDPNLVVVLCHSKSDS
jgi:hypothetical protein